MELKDVKTLEDLKMAKSKFYSDGSKIKKLQDKIKKASLDEKAILGREISKLKEEAEILFANKQREIEENIIKDKLEKEKIDVTIPQESFSSIHPLTLIENRFREWLTANGYYETVGSSIESDEYNFERLNIPKDHPARDMQDSLYINKESLLRTHNTGFSARELEKNANKAFAQFSIGPVYRNDEDDATHSHQFTQCDIVAVGDMSFPNLISTLKELSSYVLEQEVEIRLRPSFFPFTEPSVEVDIFYNNRWIEVLGAGMLHPNVLKSAGYTNSKMNGMAAGMGIERFAMIKYGIDDIREFYKNDLRFLNQFKEAE